MKKIIKLNKIQSDIEKWSVIVNCKKMVGEDFESALKILTRKTKKRDNFFK